MEKEGKRQRGRGRERLKQQVSTRGTQLKKRKRSWFFCLRGTFICSANLFPKHSLAINSFFSHGMLSISSPYFVFPLSLSLFLCLFIFILVFLFLFHFFYHTLFFFSLNFLLLFFLYLSFLLLFPPSLFFTINTLFIRVIFVVFLFFGQVMQSFFCS